VSRTTPVLAVLEQEHLQRLEAPAHHRSVVMELLNMVIRLVHL
jgi:hypothetical protein